MSKVESKTSKLLQQKLEAASQDTSPEQLRVLCYTSKMLAQIVAENHAVPSELLRELAATSIKPICERVAANPNTPTDLLLKLGAKFPKQLLANPILPLLLLENPNFVEDIPLNTLISLLKEEQVPDYILNAASKHQDEDVLMLVVSNINTCKTALEYLAVCPYQKVQEVAKLHVNLVGEIESGWEEIARQAMLNFKPQNVYEVNEEDLAIAQLIPDFLLPALHNNTLRIIALHFNTPVHVLKILCGNSFPHMIHESVALNYNAPATLIESLAKYYIEKCSEVLPDPNCYTKFQREQVLTAIASNPNIPISLLEKLYQHRSDLIRRAVAANPNTPVELLDLLADSTDIYIRSNIATNPNTSTSSLKKLCVDRDDWIRLNAAENINMPANLLYILARDRDSNVRLRVAIHSNTPKRALSVLAEDESEWTRCNVAKHPNTTGNLLSALATEKNHAVRSYVAQNSNTPVSLLKILAQDEHLLVRQAVASNPNTPLYLLKELTSDENFNVELGLVTNPNTLQNMINEKITQKFPQQLAKNLATPANMLIALAKHPDRAVRILVAENKNAPQEALEILANDKRDYVRHKAASHPKMCKDKFAKITLERIAKTSAPSFSRFIVFLHAQAPQQALVKNYRSESWLERYAIAQNPNTPKHIISELTLDANQIVRAAAYEAIKHIM